MTMHSRKSPAITCGVLLVAAVLVLYLLSVPPVVLIVSPPPTLRAPRPAWIVNYAAPYNWLKDHTPLRKPLNRYWQWHESHVTVIEVP